MSQSCGCKTSDNAQTKCPHCHEEGVKVSEVTLKAQLKKEHYEGVKVDKDSFNFCKSPTCDTVYYSGDGSEWYGQEAIKSKVTVKNDDPKTPLCYCKKLLKQDVLGMIERGEEDIPGKIKHIISQGKSFCEKSNPKGTCCTEEIKDFLSEHGIEEEKKESQSCCESSASCGC